MAIPTHYKITIPSASGLAGRPYIIKKINDLNISASIVASSGTIEAASSLGLPYNGDIVTLYSDGTEWKIYSRIYGQLTQEGVTYLNELLAGTGTIESPTGHISTLTASNLTATTGTIKTLESTTGHVTTLTTNNLTATTGNILTLSGTTGHVTTFTSNDFTATNANITSYLKSNAVLYKTTKTQSYTIEDGYDSLCYGPITIANLVSITVIGRFIIL